MKVQTLKTRHRNDMHYGGFAGLREHRLVMSPRVFGFHKEPATHSGIGNFVYLADARFNPLGETHMHPHHEVDVLSLMVEGRIHHEGSLGHGEDIEQGQVQVQRAGGEGFRHNEINPDQERNRMLQMWVLPEVPGVPAGYQVHNPKAGERTRVYGGGPESTETYAAKTCIDIVNLNKGQGIDLEGEFLIYLTKGQGTMDGHSLEDGHLVEGEASRFEATEDVQFILIQVRDR